MRVEIEIITHHAINPDRRDGDRVRWFVHYRAIKDYQGAWRQKEISARKALKILNLMRDKFRYKDTVRGIDEDLYTWDFFGREPRVTQEVQEDTQASQTYQAALGSRNSNRKPHNYVPWD